MAKLGWRTNQTNDNLRVYPCSLSSLLSPLLTHQHQTTSVLAGKLNILIGTDTIAAGGD